MSTSNYTNNTVISIKLITPETPLNTNHFIQDTTIDNANTKMKNEREFSEMTKAELVAKCSSVGILKCSSKTKSQLIELIESKNNNAVEVAPTIAIAYEDKSSSTTSIIPTTHLKPLIKWSGGKSDEIKQFSKYFPTQYTKYIEPFVGGGSVFFHLNPDSAVISDVHTELIDLYRCIGEGQMRKIHKFMEMTPNDEETYYRVRDEMPIENELDNAQRFYYQRKTCFRGMMRYNRNGKFNIPFGKYKTINYSDLLNREYEDLLKKTVILNKGFEYIFENYNDENHFMFLDPPYDSEFTDYGYCRFGKEEQRKLAELFKATKIKCLMVIGKTDFIEELYRGYIVDEYDKKYRFKLYDNRIGDEINTKHLVIKNY
jgi:DNA adenine methylase